MLLVVKARRHRFSSARTIGNQLPEDEDKKQWWKNNAKKVDRKTDID